MKTRFSSLVVFACISSSYIFSQNQPAPKTPNVLEEFDQTLEQAAERAMHSVVEIDVTGYGAPERDESSSQLLQLQRSLGSGVIVDPMVTSSQTTTSSMVPCCIHVVLTPTTVEIVPYHTSLVRKQRVYDAKLIGTNWGCLLG